MRTRTILASVAGFFVGLAICLAADPNMGTWKLNEAKSKFAPGAAKNTTVVYEPAGDMIKVIVDGVDAAGKPAHNEWTGKFDGKDYPVTGEATYDSRSYTKVDDTTMTLTTKKGGKLVANGKIVVAPDGKSRILTVTPADPKNASLVSTAVYDKP